MYRVYFILNRLNGKAYAGFTNKTVRERFRRHLSYTKSQTAFHRALRKYGSEIWTLIKVWEGDSKSEAYEVEKRVIAEMDLRNSAKGYNLAEGGLGGSAPKTPEARAKIAAAHRGMKASPEARKAMSDAAKRRAARDKEFHHRISKLGTAARWGG